MVRRVVLGLALFSAQLPSPHVVAAPLGSGFVYQGQLTLSGSPVSGSCDCQFSLWSASAAGTQSGATQTLSPIQISNGIFSAELNGNGEFGLSPFATAEERWLEIAVRCPTGSGSYTTLSPRQKVTATPYAITTLSIVDAAVTTAKLADLAVTAPKLADLAVTAPKLAVEAVGEVAIAPAAVSTVKLADNAVTGLKLADNTVTGVKLADNSVTGVKLADNAVTGVKLADNAVTSVKLADLAVTSSKLGASSVTVTALADLAVTAGKLADLAVTPPKLAVEAVGEVALAPAAVTTVKLANNAVTGVKLADNTVTTTKLADLAVTSSKLGANSVTVTALADLAVTTVKLAPNTVTNDRLAVDASSLNRVSGGVMTSVGGLVGIGTTLAPAEMLEVNGAIKLTGDTRVISKAPRVLHSVDLATGCPPSRPPGADLITQSFTLGRSADVSVTATMVRNVLGLADLRLFVDGVLVARTMTETAILQWEAAEVVWVGTLAPGGHTVVVRSPVGNAWGCGPDAGSINTVIFE